MGQGAIRLRAARLAAGYVVGKDAAEALGIPVATYRSMENGHNGLSDAVIRVAIPGFDSSSSFLRDGKPETRSDRLALRIADIIEKVEDPSSEPPDPAEMVERLRQTRIEKGYRTAAAAAQAMGWANATYSTHESGYNAAPLERLMGYALAFEVRPEFIVLGERPAPETEATDWRDLRATGGLVVSVDGNAWSWLRSEAAGMPVLALTDTLTLLSTRLAIPPDLLPIDLSSLKGRAFAVMDPAKTGVLLIVDPQAGEGRMVNAVAGRLEITDPSVADMAVTDPVKKRVFKEPVRLGALIHTISFVVDGS